MMDYSLAPEQSQLTVFHDQRDVTTRKQDCKQFPSQYFANFVLKLFSLLIVWQMYVYMFHSIF